MHAHARVHLVGGREVDPDVDAPLHSLAGGGHLRVHDAAPRRQPLHAHMTRTYGGESVGNRYDDRRQNRYTLQTSASAHACIIF
jgi:hypothetical protein